MLASLLGKPPFKLTSTPPDGESHIHKAHSKTSDVELSVGMEISGCKILEL